MPPKTPPFFAGIDWSDSWQDVAVVDRDGKVVARARIEETPAGLRELFQLLDGLRNSHTHGRRQVPIGIETTRGLLVHALRARRQPVYHVPPTAVAAHRRRLSTVRKKSDRTDAEIIALALRDGWSRMSPQPTNSDQAAAVAVLVTALDRTQGTRRRLQHQLRSMLRQAHPAAVGAWAHLDDGLRRPEARAVLAAAPTAVAAAKLRVPRLAVLLREAGRFRLVDAEAARLRELFTAPVLRLAPAVEQVLEHDVRAILSLFDAACRVEDSLAGQLEAELRAHPHAPILLSFPGLGPAGAARVLAALGDDPTRFASIRGLRAYAGLAPLTWASGVSRTVTHRRICHRPLKAACHRWAFASLTRSPGCRALYDARRTAGDTYAGALRRVASHLLGGLHHCLATGDLYREDIAFPPRP